MRAAVGCPTVSEQRYPSMNNVLAKKENANTAWLTW
jgi:hypothetical protein